MELRNILFIILFINATFLFSEDSSLSSHYFYNRCQLKEEKIIGYGTLEEQSISESNYYPCWIFSIENINEIDSFLYYVPYVTLSVMTFPAIIHATQSPYSGILALVVGIVAAWRGWDLFRVALCACGAVLLLEFFII